MSASGRTIAGAGSPLRTALVVAGALLAIVSFALQGPGGLPGLLSSPVASSPSSCTCPPAGASSCRDARAHVLLAQAERGFNYYDPIPVVLAVLALRGRCPRERAAGTWAAPVGSRSGLSWRHSLPCPQSWSPSPASSGSTRCTCSCALHFHALRRLVPWEKSQGLLWLFPVLGTIGAFQLFLKTQGLGALLFARMSFRNFYSRLAWGQSDFISAVLEFCICATSCSSCSSGACGRASRW